MMSPFYTLNFAKELCHVYQVPHVVVPVLLAPEGAL